MPVYPIPQPNPWVEAVQRWLRQQVRDDPTPPLEWTPAPLFGGLADILGGVGGAAFDPADLVSSMPMGAPVGMAAKPLHRLLRGQIPRLLERTKPGTAKRLEEWSRWFAKQQAPKREITEFGGRGMSPPWPPSPTREQLIKAYQETPLIKVSRVKVPRYVDQPEYITPGPYRTLEEWVLRTPTQPGMPASHFSSYPDYLAHLRGTQRKLATGERTWHLEEAQSDLMNALMRKGVRPGTGPPPETFNLAHLEDLSAALYHAKWDAVNAARTQASRLPGDSKANKDLADWATDWAVLRQDSPMPPEVADFLAANPAMEAPIQRAVGLARDEGIIDDVIRRVRRRGETLPYTSNIVAEKWFEPAARTALLRAAQTRSPWLTWTPAKIQAERWAGRGHPAVYEEQLPDIYRKLGKPYGVAPETVRLAGGPPSLRLEQDISKEAFRGVAYRRTGLGRLPLSAYTKGSLFYPHARPELEALGAKFTEVPSPGPDVYGIRIPNPWLERLLREGLPIY